MISLLAVGSIEVSGGASSDIITSAGGWSTLSTAPSSIVVFIPLDIVALSIGGIDDSSCISDVGVISMGAIVRMVTVLISGSIESIGVVDIIFSESVWFAWAALAAIMVLIMSEITVFVEPS